MNKTTKEVLVIVAIFAALMALGVSSMLSRRIPDNPPELTGNTAGNLNNGGLFCEDGGTVYFANAYDDNTLYAMNSDESDIHKLSNAQVESINSAGNYLYYYQTNTSSSSPFAVLTRYNGIYRTHKKSLKSVCLVKELAINVALCGNTLYFQHFGDKGTTLYKTGTAKTEPVEVLDYDANPASIRNGMIYFNGTQHDHHLYTLNTADDSVSMIWDGNLWNPVAEGDYIYYMDLNTNYNLCRYSLTDQKVTVLSTERIDFFNVYGNYVYYQTNSKDNPCLMRVTTDGMNEEIVMEGIFENINITSEYVYFNQFDMPVPVYKTSTTGPIAVSTFDAAMHAAMEGIE